MKKPFRKGPLSRLDARKPSLIFLFLAVFVGGAIRLGPVLQASFPLNDGGFFYTMTQELVAEEFSIPKFSTYNKLQIPYAYPPLGFFLAGGLQKVTGWDLLDIYRILPAALSIFAIPAFYFLAKEITDDDWALGLSVLMFSFLSPTMEWLVMGGGMTRSPGFVFSLLAIRSGYLMYTRDKKTDILFTTLFSALTVLFHPEAAVHTAAGIGAFLMIKGRSKKGIIKSSLVVIFVLVLTSPWWLQIVRFHGVSPFLSAGKTGMHNLLNYLWLLSFNITQETGLTSMGVFALIGIFLCFATRKILLPMWLIITYLASPRSAPLYLTPVVALLAGEVLSYILRKLDRLQQDKSHKEKDEKVSFSLLSKLFLTILILQWSLSSIINVSKVSVQYTLDSSDLSAMVWIRENIPENSKFLVLTGITPFKDATSEWFPAIANRVSVATIQGREWIQEADFNKKYEESIEIQECVIDPLACFEWNIETEIDYNYIYLRKTIPLQNFSTISTTGLEFLLRSLNQYELVFENKSVLLFQKFTP